MKKIIKKVSVLTLMPIAALPAISVVACSKENSYNRLTFAVAPFSSLNFIRYKAASKLAAPTVLPLMTSMPPEAIKNRYQLEPAKMKHGHSVISSKAFTFGSMQTSANGETYLLDATNRNITISIKQNLTWSNGKPIISQHYVDTMKAMLDLNNSSEYVYEIESLGIKNATKAYEAQIAYMLAHNNVPYDDPFNYKKLPIGSGPGKYPEELKDCLGVGIEAKGKYSFIIHFNHKETLNFFQSLNTPIFWPINRDNIMATGGFDNFGKEPNTILSSGAHKVDYFDPKYGVEFVKNNNFYNKDNVITPNINFRFITNPSTIATLYKDHRILTAVVGKDYIAQYQSDPDLRRRLTRQTGIGTLSMFLNRDPKHHLNKIFNDKNFRKAIFYGMDRNQLLPALNLDFSNPVAIYTAATSKTPNAFKYLNVFKNQVYTPSGKNSTEKPFMISPLESREYRFQNDFFERKDGVYDKALAYRFLEKAKESNPEFFPLTLDFPYKSGDPIGQSLGVVLKDFFDRSFHGQLTIDAHPLPTLVYNDFKDRGKWDMNIIQVDPKSRNPWDYLGEFVKDDSPNPRDGKTIGFNKNHSGGATYNRYFHNLKPGESSNIQQRFGINDFNWDITKWLITNKTSVNDETKLDDISDILDRIKKDGEGHTYQRDSNSTKIHLNNEEEDLYNTINEYVATEYAKLVASFRGNMDNSKEKWLNEIITSKFLFAKASIDMKTAFKTIYKTIEEIERDMIPTIPLAEADNVWKVNRALGAAPTPQGQWVDLEYLYDGDNIPLSWLDRYGK